MNRSADQALRSLLPTHNGPFPPQLVDLAGSLLAQSRHRAATLKADEDIARSYACAHIACDRLKTSLNLPPIEPRPPIQPRVYKRLYAYMNTVLKPTAATASRAESGHASPTKHTPSQATPAARRAQPTAGTPSRTPSRMPAAKAFMNLPPPPKPAAGTFPPWLRPTVRYVCHELGYALLAPTIMAGLTVIHRDVADEAKAKQKGSRRAEDEAEDDDDEDMTAWLEENLTSLVAALYLYSVTSWRGVLRERQAQASGGASAAGQDAALEERQFQLDEKAILGAFDKVRSVVGKGGGGSNDSNSDAAKPIGGEAWLGWQDLQRRTFRDALVVVSEQQWLQSDWYQDISTLGSSGGMAGNDDDLDGDGRHSASDGEGDDDNDAHIPTKVWRADSMFQARYDFLSESKQAEYDAWRAGLLETMAGAAAQSMEVDS